MKKPPLSPFLRTSVGAPYITPFIFSRGPLVILKSFAGNLMQAFVTSVWPTRENLESEMGR